MAPQKMKINMPGVASGKEISGSPTGEGFTSEERVRLMLQGSISEDSNYEGWGAHLFQRDIQIVSASTDPGRVVFRFKIQAEHCNRLGNLHGGCTATIFDICTTCALAPIAKEGFWAYAGVTRTLSVTYLRPIPEGETVLIEAEVVHAGKRLCALKGVMKRESDGAVLTTCEHGKASIDPEVSKL
ncbi:Acyl-coenzyme A thioesterase [Lachnellula subtilissima]|uniref:Acyl-coenzyme A thioesterase n=1 Tax=Lachnellula subtilissima TaxID=602034 RepID=A0A8H8U811_9HELO|nr:Acyl-coenzyme A thioesterase [Lachnellula subtilissima]